MPDDAIDREGPVPIYIQLAAILRRQVTSGDLPPDRPIPSKRVLCQRYEVAGDTVDKAVAILREAGLVYTVMGRGIYVAEGTPPAGG